MRKLVGGGYGAFVAVLVIGALAAVWLLTRGAPTALADLDPPPVPVAATVTTTTLDYAADAALSASVSEGPGVLATGLAGTVTAVGVQPGQELAPGAMVYAVDGVPVRAYADDVVLYRALRLGDRGPDVAAAQRLLASVTQTSVVADGTFGREADRAVRAYERSIGVEQPTGVLDPAWFTRLPTTPFVVATVEVQAGQPTPSAGEAVATATAAVAAISLATDSRGPAGDYEFVSLGQVVPVRRGDDGSWQVTDVAAASRLVLAGDLTQSVASISGRVRVVDAAPGQAVPGAAVVTDTSGATCVVLADDREVRPVDVTGAGADGLARITPTLPDGSEVLLNPLVVVGDVTCPSS